MRRILLIVAGAIICIFLFFFVLFPIVIEDTYEWDVGVAP